MLQIRIPGAEFYNERTEEFVESPDITISLEHSLISLSKWESKWHKPFLGKEYPKGEEFMDYIRCMTVTQNVPDNVYDRLTRENIDDILKYINDPMTATTINDRGVKPKRSSEIITSELIYYWMVAAQIPFSCEKWHLNRLMTLIRICGIKSQPDKKMSKRSTMQQNAALNAARRKRLNTRG